MENKTDNSADSDKFAEGLEAYKAKNYKEAFKIWYSLAEQGHAKAEYNIAFMYRAGEGVPENYAKAAEWYRKAAKNNDIEAQVMLGIMYKNGDGVSKNNVNSYMWFSIAKANGDETAKSFLEELREEMGSEDIKIAQEMATDCWENGGDAWDKEHKYPVYSFEDDIPF